MNQKMIIGNAEAICLPELGITHLEARIDTGAQTSSLHVDNIDCFEKDGQSYVAFDLHPDVYHLEQVVRCTAKLKANRKVKSSNGEGYSLHLLSTNLSSVSQDYLNTHTKIEKVSASPYAPSSVDCRGNISVTETIHNVNWSYL